MPVVTIGGGSIHYETAGEGFPLVLLHGLGSSSRSWRRQLESLSSDFCVLAWDAPGYGRSSDPVAQEPAIRFYTDSLRAFLDALGLSEIFLLGQSMGGVIAQDFYRQHPDYVRRLILADTTRGGLRDNLQDRLQKIQTMSPAQLAEERAPKLLSPSAPESLVREVASIMSQIRPLGYAFATMALASADTRNALRDLRVPLLLIWGSEDRIAPMWENMPPGARVEVISNAGHLCSAEQPERFNAILREFLRS